MHVRTGDTVLVIAGNDKGKKGLIREVFREQQRVIVEGVNLRWKHRKPTQQNPKGERIQRECSIHASNVMHLDEKTGKGLRHRPETAKAKKKTATREKAEKTGKAAKTTKK